jgi:hypothetical protein
MNEAHDKIKKALDKNGVGFYASWADDNMTMEQRVDYSIDVVGVRMMGATAEWAAYGRKKTGRTMPV